MLIFKHAIILTILIMLIGVWHPFFVGALIFMVAFFMPIHIVAALAGYFLDTVFLSGRDPLIAYQNTILFVILVLIAQYIRTRLIR